MTIGCFGCNIPGFPWNLNFASSVAGCFAAGIVIAAFAALIVIFSKYRLESLLPYSWLRHLEFFILFLIFPLFVSHTFGGSLAWLLCFPEFVLEAFVLKYVSSAGFPYMLVVALLVHLLYTGIFACLDRPLVKREEKSDSSGTENGHRSQQEDSAIARQDEC